MPAPERIEPLADYAANTAKRAGNAVTTWRTTTGLVARAQAAVTAWDALTTATEAAGNLQRALSADRAEMIMRGGRP
jgi:hypothetical protein